MSRSLRNALSVALVTYAAVLTVVLFNPSPAVGSELVSNGVLLGLRLHFPAPLVEQGRIEFGLNVLAFVPLSLLGSLLRPAVSVSVWISAGFVGSLVVEATQVALPERMATHSDVVANTLGAALGAMSAWILLRTLRQ